MKNIQYKTTKPDIEQYWELFESTGWNEEYKFRIEQLDTAISNTWFSISAYLNNAFVGYGRIISDGVHHALIVDLIVAPEYQSQGIGSEILKKLLKKCTDNRIRDIQLFAAKDKYTFYENFGFAKRDISAPGMEYIHPQN